MNSLFKIGEEKAKVAALKMGIGDELHENKLYSAQGLSSLGIDNVIYYTLIIDIKP